jgi:citrate lyase subunit beta/citryl-CoA lyase
MCIHPKHLPILHDIFTPSTEDIAHWQAIIDAMVEAEKQGSAAIRLDGRLIDVAHVKTAHKNLDRARRLGLLA